MTNKLPRYTCNRCGHTWIPRRDTVPTVCASCHSPYWNKERTLDKDAFKNHRKEK